MAVYVEPRRLSRSPRVKDLAAGNAIGFHLWYSSLKPHEQKARLRALGNGLYQLLAIGVNFILSGLNFVKDMLPLVSRLLSLEFTTCSRP